MNDKNLALMDGIMGGISQLPEWAEIQLHDPMIVAADARWKAAIEEAKALLPRELYDELSDASFDEIVAHSSAGILFGIHVADAIRDVASRPADLSRHILKRLEAQDGMNAKERGNADKLERNDMTAVCVKL